MSNPPSQRLSVVLTSTELSVINQAFDSIEQQLPFLFELTPEELKRTSKIDVSNHDFVRETLNVLSTQQMDLPANISKEEIEKDLQLYDQLNGILLRVQQLMLKIRHTGMVAGGEAYDDSLKVYQFVKTLAHMGVSGYGALSARLATRFAAKRRKKEDKPLDDNNK